MPLVTHVAIVTLAIFVARVALVFGSLKRYTPCFKCIVSLQMHSRVHHIHLGSSDKQTNSCDTSLYKYFTIHLAKSVFIGNMSLLHPHLLYFQLLSFPLIFFSWRPFVCSCMKNPTLNAPLSQNFYIILFVAHIPFLRFFKSVPNLIRNLTPT